MSDFFFAPFEGHPLDSAFGIPSVSDKLFIYIFDKFYFPKIGFC